MHFDLPTQNKLWPTTRYMTDDLCKINPCIFSMINFTHISRVRFSLAIITTAPLAKSSTHMGLPPVTPLP